MVTNPEYKPASAGPMIGVIFTSFAGVTKEAKGLLTKIWPYSSAGFCGLVILHPRRAPEIGAPVILTKVPAGKLGTPTVTMAPEAFRIPTGGDGNSETEVTPGFPSMVRVSVKTL